MLISSSSILYSSPLLMRTVSITREIKTIHVAYHYEDHYTRVNNL